MPPPADRATGDRQGSPNGDPPPPGLSDAEKAAHGQMDARYRTGGSGYALMMVTRPQTLGYSRVDSPAGLAAWFYDKFAYWPTAAATPSGR